MKEVYRVLDLKTEEVKTYPLTLITESGYSRTLFEDVLDDGRVLVVVHRKIGQGKNGRPSLVYRLLGDPVDSSYTEIPLPGLAIRDYRFSLSGNQLAFVSTYFPMKGDRLIYEKKETGFGGIYFGKIDVAARKEILLRKMPAQEVLSPFPGLDYKEGVLTSSEIKIQQVIFREDGETDLFLLPYYYNGQVFKSRFMLVARMDKNENLSFVKIISDGVEFKDSEGPITHHGYVFYPKGKTTYMITFEDKKNLKQQKNYVPVRELNECVLSVTRIDPEGNIRKTYDAPIEVREKHFVDLRGFTVVDEQTDALYFFAKRNKALRDWYWPGVFNPTLSNSLG
jgi:hypothetical protein